MSENDPYAVVGIIDSYGAIHHAPVSMGGECEFKTHETLWPGKSHKRWRFNLRDWQLEKSVLSALDMTEAERDDVVALIRKHYKPPNWLIEGEEWEALGRPREGADYRRHRRKWDRINRLNIRT